MSQEPIWENCLDCGKIIDVSMDNAEEYDTIEYECKERPICIKCLKEWSTE